MRQHVNEQTKKGFLFPINTHNTHPDHQCDLLRSSVLNTVKRPREGEEKQTKVSPPNVRRGCSHRVAWSHFAAKKCVFFAVFLHRVPP